MQLRLGCKWIRDEFSLSVCVCVWYVCVCVWYVCVCLCVCVWVGVFVLTVSFVTYLITLI